MSSKTVPECTTQYMHVSIDSLLEMRHAVQAMRSHDIPSTGLFSGDFRTRLRGQGSDFDDLRLYTAGDEPRHIDWKASARTQRLHTRLYREEREHRISLLVDLRHSLYTGTVELRSARACHLAAALLWQAINAGSRVNLIVLLDQKRMSGLPETGHAAAIEACLLLASGFEAGQKQYNPKSSSGTGSGIQPLQTLAETAHWLMERRGFSGTTFWISAFDHSGSDFPDAMRALSQGCQQVAIHVDDRMLDQGLPAGRYAYRTGQVGQRRSAHRSITRRRARALRNQLQLLRQQREALFARLDIPLLYSRPGAIPLIITLRELGYLP